jgi:hypothetical protein
VAQIAASVGAAIKEKFARDRKALHGKVDVPSNLHFGQCNFTAKLSALRRIRHSRGSVLSKAVAAGLLNERMINSINKNQRFPLVRARTYSGAGIVSSRIMRLAVSIALAAVASAPRMPGMCCKQLLELSSMHQELRADDHSTDDHKTLSISKR